MKRTLKIIGLALGAVLALLVLVGVAAALLVDLDGIANEQVAKQRPELEDRLGRKVEVGKVSTRLFPTLAVRLESVRISAQEQEAPPLLEVGPIRVELSLWDALVSRGEKITVKELVISGLRVNLVRAADGTLSYEDILARLEEDEGPQKAPSAAPDEPSGLGGLVLGELRIEGAELHLLDHATPTGEPVSSTLRKLNLRLHGVRAGSSAKLRLDAALFSEATNFELEAKVGPLPAGTKGEPAPTLQALTVRLDQVDLSRLSPYLPRSAGVQIESALASASFEVGDLGSGHPVPVKGFFEVRRLQLQGGKSFDFRADADLQVDPAGPGVEISRLELKLGEVQLVATGALQQLATAPRFRDFHLESTTLSPGALLSYFPAAREQLPPGTRFAGAAHLVVNGSGDAARQALHARLDLGPLDVHAPGVLVKPAAVPLGLELKGELTANDVNLERLALVLDELELVIRGTVKDFARPTFDLTASAPPFSLDRLARLAPTVREGLEAQKASASGKGQLAGHLRGTASNLDAALDFSLQGMKLQVPGTELQGDLRLRAQAKGDPASSLRAELDFDANNAVIRVKEVMDKGLKTPLRLDLAVRRTPERLEVERFDLRLAELGMRVKGGVDYPKNMVDVRVDLDRLDLEKFARTVTALPARWVKQSHLALRLTLKGDPDRMETLELAMTGVEARLGRSDLRGEILLKNPARPELTMKVRSKLLDLDQLLGDDEGEQKPAEAARPGQPPPPPADDPELRKYRVLAQLEAEKLLYEGTLLSRFVGVVRLEDGRLLLEEARFNAYGGTVSAKGTEAEIWRGKMPFKANVTATGIDLGEALSEQTRYGRVLQGKADLGLQLSGKGFETADLEQFLKGTIDLSMKEGRFSRASVTEAVVGKLEGLDKIPGAKLQQVRGENAIRDLVARLEVRDGKLNLAKPVTFAVDQSRATLGGAVGIGGGLFLEGTYFLPGQVLDRATGGRCRSDQELPIPISIAGTVDGPQYLPRPGQTAAAVVRACLATAATGAAASKLGNALGVEVPTSGADAKKRAEAEAQKRRQEAEELARNEAEKRRQEAERQAREKAKQKAKNVVKGLGF